MRRNRAEQGPAGKFRAMAPATSRGSPGRYTRCPRSPRQTILRPQPSSRAVRRRVARPTQGAAAHEDIGLATNGIEQPADLFHVVRHTKSPLAIPCGPVALSRAAKSILRSFGRQASARTRRPPSRRAQTTSACTGWVTKKVATQSPAARERMAGLPPNATYSL